MEKKQSLSILYDEEKKVDSHLKNQSFISFSTSNLLSLKKNPSLLDYILRRLESIWNLLIREKPRISLEDGSVIDFEKGEIVINGDLTLNVKGNLYIKADKHIIINSGREKEKEREGYIYSIWLNSDIDSNGLPLKNEEKNIDNTQCQEKNQKEKDLNKKHL